MSAPDADPAGERHAPLIEARGLVRTFARAKGGAPLRAVDGVSCAVAPGEIVAIFGRSGSGKTTLLNLLSGLDRPDAGSVRFGGRDMTGASAAAWAALRRRAIGFVFQRFLLHGQRTALDNTLLPALLAGRTVREARALAARALEEVGLAEHTATPCARLSGGQSQRVALARALVAGPSLLLADEPTGNLDAETAWQMLQLLDRVRRARGLALVVTTHDDLVREVADQIWTMEAGRLDTAPRGERAPAASAHTA